MKTRSAWQTPVGAAAGATPVLLGAAAVGRAFSPWAFVLFGIVYFWQFPHSMAIAWRYRQEFAAAGVKVAAVTDPSGRTAGIWAVLGAAALLPVSLAPLLLGLAGAGYGIAVIALDVAYLAMSVCFARRRTTRPPAACCGLARLSAGDACRAAGHEMEAICSRHDAWCLQPKAA